MSFRNIIWDFDGTLFDTYPAIVAAFRRTVADFGAEIAAAEVERLVRVSFTHILATLQERFGFEPEAVSEHFFTLYLAMPPESQPPFPGARALCRAVVEHGGQNAIATHRRRDSMLRLLEAYGMRDLFCGFITLDDGLPRKPDPAPFRLLMERCGMDAADTLAVGDRDLDIEGAQAAGLRACFFGDAPHRSRPDFEVRSLRALWPLMWDEAPPPPSPNDGPAGGRQQPGDHIIEEPQV